MTDQFRRAGLLAGEFIIIVVGVLVALAVDQWSQARSDRLLETRYLQRLKADLEFDTTLFARFDSRALSAKAGILRDLLAPDALARLRARPNLVDDLNYSKVVALPTNRPATFEELQSTGRLSLIQDTDLRGALSYYYAGFNHISKILATPFGDYRKRLGGAAWSGGLRLARRWDSAGHRGIYARFGEPVGRRRYESRDQL